MRPKEHTAPPGLGTSVGASSRLFAVSTTPAVDLDLRWMPRHNPKLRQFANRNANVSLTKGLIIGKHA